MRLRNYSILIALIFTVCFLQAGTGSGARLSEGNEITSSPQKAAESGPASRNNKTGRPPVTSARNEGGMTAQPQSGSGRDKVNSAPEKENQRYVSIDFDNVDISLFIKFISELTGKNFIIDNNVKGKVTIISPTRISVDEAYKVFESVLEVNGFTVVPSGKVIKILPSIEARSKDIETRFGTGKINPQDKVVTQVIPLKYASADELKKVFSAFMSKGSIMISYDPTGMLIVTDVLSNISRLLKIIEMIDIPGTGEEITVIPLKHATAQTMSANLGTVFKTIAGAGKKTAANSQITIVPDERTNSLIVVASEVDTLKIKELLNLIDREIPRGDGDIHVYYLQNADAEALSKTLMAIPTDTKQGGQKGTAPVLSKDIQIIADKPTNSLVITAEKDDYLILEDVIQKLDRPRSMVYIEALIMEVSMKKEFELGVQWQGGSKGDRSVGVFGGSNPGTNNFPSIDSNGVVSLSTGLSLGVLGDTISIGGLSFQNIGAVIRTYATDSDVQILSTPQIMTTDNEEAEIKVVDNVPFITSRDTTANSYINYSNYEFKDVGVILNITPQINQERFVRLKIAQEVSQVLSKDPVTGQPTTLKREAKTTVVIKDGETVVIGGLIDETDNRTNYKVPIFSRIPILGLFFKSNTKSLDKKNLYIFLTPHIIENPAEANEVYKDKKGQIDAVQAGVISMHNNGNTPEDARLAELGYKYLRLRDYKSALKYFKKALNKNPDNPYAMLNMGYIYQMQGDKQKAIEIYERLIAMNPPDRAAESTDPLQAGKKLTDIAKENLKSLKTVE